jgi:hypothetical protein
VLRLAVLHDAGLTHQLIDRGHDASNS